MGKVKKEKLSKVSIDKKNKSEIIKKKKSCDKKKNSTGEGARKYGYISAKSVITMAEAAGFSGLHEEVAKNLAEDVTYRLRYVIQQCKKYMTHCKRNKLSSSDINEVLKMCDISSIYGYTVDEPLKNFIYIKEADIFVLEDNVVDLYDLALSEIKVHQSNSYIATGLWIKSNEVKTVHEEVKMCNLVGPSNNDSIKQNCRSSVQFDNVKHGSENNGNETKIPINLIKYYGITCNSILGHLDLKIVFHDLSTSTRIIPIVPYILNFITIALNKLGSERQIRRLLQTVQALSKNNSIDFSPYSATTRIVNAILLIIAFDKKTSKINYNYSLRLYAAQVLATVLCQWCTRDEQKISIVKKMGKLLTDFKVSLKVHYGAIALLISMGYTALESTFCRIIGQYLNHLDDVKSCATSSSLKDVAMLEEIILAAAVFIYRHPGFGCRKLSDLDHNLRSYFGDTLCSVLPYFWYKSCFLTQKNKSSFQESGFEFKYPKTLKYMNSRYKPHTKKITVENVFTLPKLRKKKNTRIIFKFAGSKPVPEVNLKRKRLDGRYSQFIAGRESEGHVVVAGKRLRYNFTKHCINPLLPVGYIFSIL